MTNILNVFPLCYLAPISYYKLLTNCKNVVFDINENFIKQTIRSRCQIMSPNGLQTLSIPLINVSKKQVFKNIKICNTYHWQKIHFKSFEAGYRKSPYFEYYESLFSKFYLSKKYNYLIDFSSDLFQFINESLNVDIPLKCTSNYIESNNKINDFRSETALKINFNKLTIPKYIQVFEDRNGFLKDLSIIDLIFNEGPNAKNYLKKIVKND